MKNYLMYSVAAITVLVILLAVSINSQVPDDKVTAFNSSVNYEKKNNTDSAIAVLMREYPKNESDYLYNLRLGWLHYSKGDHSGSLTYYKKAAKIKPGTVEPLLGQAYPLAALEKWNDLRDLYLLILKSDPKNYTANLRLGQHYLALADYKTAKKYLDQAYALYPGEYEINLSLGWTNYYLGNSALAKEMLTAALMLNANDESAIKGLGLLK